MDHHRSRLRTQTDHLLYTKELETRMAEISLLSVVALMRDLPEHGLVRGQVGTVVELLAPRVFEVDFSDDSGRSYASIAVGGEDLIRLYHEPVHEAA